jgi:hypothetical protein
MFRLNKCPKIKRLKTKLAGGDGDRQNSFRHFPHHSIEPSNIKHLMPFYYHKRLRSSGAIRHLAMG